MKIDDLISFETLSQELVPANMSKKDEIEMNKAFSSLFTEVQKEIKEETCFCCGKTVSSFCKSHFVPRFCLDNISTNGFVTSYNAIIKLPTMGISIGKEHPGVNEAGVFRLICRDCDSTHFQDYENPDSYSSQYPSQKILAEIAMKNYLKFISKRRLELRLSEKSVEKNGDDSPSGRALRKRHNATKEVRSIDLATYIKNYKRAKKNVGKQFNDYYIIYYRLLDYVAPIAVQTPFSLFIDLEGNVVNDSFSSPTYNATDIHLCVFPLQTKTAILLFINNNDMHYKKFYKQLRELPSDEQLGVINYMFFLYCEDYFLAGDISEKVDLSLFKTVAGLTPIVRSPFPQISTWMISRKYTLANWKSIPNLLSEQYKVR